ncbi:MAG: hypothetical protein EOP06_19020 [Proteobacteria bacterium]|nr:MAG: hypothetical protein EOP06_19020 [Pseudomonadota bacterium]
MTSLGSLFKKASLVSREAQNASTQAKASVPGTMFSGEFPFGWMVEIAGDKLFVFACATNDNIDRSDLTDRVSAELDQHKATIISTKKVRIYCLVRPKHSDLTSIQLKLIKLAEEAKKAPTELTAEICWLEDFHFEERKSINLPFVDRISTRSLNLNEILNQEDLIKEFEECMEEIDACVSELKMTSAWVDL